VAKIIRKRIEKPDFKIDLEAYDTSITDLIGIRALHLFKNDWGPIHEFVLETWRLHEDPIAYYREEDPKPSMQGLSDPKPIEKLHEFGHRSIHYVIKSQPARSVHLAELQVRTLFEEGWSEIDHRIRYSRLSDNPYLRNS
jgi:ppGpp synthetase/RelA/SpoT-type nucleotidyltranferase